MPLNRLSYWELPFAIRKQIEHTTGLVTSATPTGTGHNSVVAEIVRTTLGHFFVKALPAHHRSVWTQAREAQLAPHLRELAPALLARVADHGWDVLIFEALHGHQANYQPDSPDWRQAVHLLTRLGTTPCPAGVELKEATQRLHAYTDPADLRYFAGQALLHTDPNPANIIIGANGPHLVDWGWATRGAPWLDPAYWVIWLIAAGHTPARAEQLASTIPAWNHAPTHGITAFATANARLWHHIAGPHPDPFTANVAASAHTWCDYRRALPC